MMMRALFLLAGAGEAGMIEEPGEQVEGFPCGGVGEISHDHLKRITSRRTYKRDVTKAGSSGRLLGNVATKDKMQGASE